MFLDRDPYIRYWRPTYRVFGPVIRMVKGFFIALVPGRTANELASLRIAVAKLSVDQELLSSTLRQVAATLAAIEQQLPERHDQLTAQTMAQWTAIEHLLVSFMANSSRSEGFLNITAGSQENHRDAMTHTAAS